MTLQQIGQVFLVYSYHIDYLNIENIPSGKWYCPDCRKKVLLNVIFSKVNIHVKLKIIIIIIYLARIMSTG